MEFTITKEQINKLSQECCNLNQRMAVTEIKNNLKSWFPEAFKFEKEVKKWYKGRGYLFYLNNFNPSKTIWMYEGYGFSDGNWAGNMTFKEGAMCVESLATEEEIKQALLNEAKKRGFKKNVEYLSAWNNYTECSFPTKLIFNININCLSYYEGNECIFQNGVWAKIIKKPKRKMTVSQICKELGEEIEIIKD